MRSRDQGGVEAAAIAAVVALDGKRVLEIGCGSGRLTQLAAARAASVYAFDPNADAVAEAKALLGPARNRRVRFAVHGIEELDIPRRRFDLALAAWSLWCVPVEGVVDALRRIHRALVPNGILIDTQPLSPRSAVEGAGRRLGTLDMREWASTIKAVDRSFETLLHGGLYSLEHEARYVVTDSFESGAQLVETVSGWRGTHISPSLARRVTSADPPAAVHQEVRLRLLRACDID